MDLTLMTKRIKRDWFNRYLLEPASLRPGTRMPTFWPGGVAVNRDVLDGNTEGQINALWAYLSRGTEADLPPGLVQGKKEIVTEKEAVIYRNFIAGAGSRAIGVGYPEKANLAFDANEMRLALIWQGSFIDAARHSSGRGEGFEPPLGDRVQRLPAGVPFAVLTDPNAAWPADSARQAGYRMRGYHLDEQRRPAFRYIFKDFEVEDYPVAVGEEVDPFLRRTLTLRTTLRAANLWFRAATGGKIEPGPNGSPPSSVQ